MATVLLTSVSGDGSSSVVSSAFCDGWSSAIPGLTTMMEYAAYNRDSLHFRRLTACHRMTLVVPSVNPFVSLYSGKRRRRDGEGTSYGSPWSCKQVTRQDRCCWAHALICDGGMCRTCSRRCWLQIRVAHSSFVCSVKQFLSLMRATMARRSSAVFCVSAENDDGGIAADCVDASDDLIEAGCFCNIAETGY